MVDISKLKPGMKIKIVDQWGENCICHQNPDGLMDSYLGRILTVHEVRRDFILVEEDKWDRPETPNIQDGHWAWFPAAIEYVVGDMDEYNDFEPASDDEFMRLFT